MKIQDIKWMLLDTHTDSRGKLTAIEGNKDVFFNIKRVFYISDVSEGSARGGHAHVDTDQLAIAVTGTVRIVVSDGTDSSEVILDSPSAGILLPRMTWTCLTDFSPGAVCLVLASTNYDKSLSIRNWESYLEKRKLPKIAEFTSGALISRPLP